MPQGHIRSNTWSPELRYHITKNSNILYYVILLDELVSYDFAKSSDRRLNTVNDTVLHVS